MKQQLNIHEKIFDLPFSWAILSEEKKKTEKKREAIKRSQCLRGRLVWGTKKRMGKDRI